MKKFTMLLTLFFCLLTITGCTMNQKPEEPACVPETLTEEETQKEELVPLLASDEESGLYLYGIRPSGVILYANGQGHYFDWDYSLGSDAAPKLYTGSFRHGSENDVAVVLPDDNGGETLRILSDESFDEDSVYTVDNTELDSYVGSAVDYTYENETVTFTFEDKSYSFDISESFDKLVFDGVTYGDSVVYSCEDGKLYAEMTPTVRSADGENDYGTAKMGITIRAQLLFDGYNISLTDFSVKGL